MAAAPIKTPPLPPGFELINIDNDSLPPLPEGFELVPPEKQISRARSLISAPIRGLIEGAGDILDAAPAKYPRKGVEAMAKRFLPSRDLPLERGLHRAGRLAPLAATGGEGVIAKIARTGAGALAGQIAEEVGAPDYIQSLAELSAFMVPKIGGKLQPSKSQKEAVDFLKSKGLTEREITPLIQSEKKLRRLGKFASKSEETAETLKSAGKKLGQGFEELKETAQAKGASLPRNKMTPFFEELDKTLNKISPRFKRLLKQDFEDFENSKMGFNDFVDFWQDINQTVKGQTGGRGVLNILKEPLQKGMKEIDPGLTQEFNKLNEFYSKKNKIGKILAPRQIDELLEAGKIYGMIGAIASGNFGIITKLLGAVAGRNLTKQLLTNPKLQNLSNQMLKSINQNKFPAALKAFSAFKKEYGPLTGKPGEEEIGDKAD